jgi:adenine-specific DNA-methyltransferase
MLLLRVVVRDSCAGSQNRFPCFLAIPRLWSLVPPGILEHEGVYFDSATISSKSGEMVAWNPHDPKSWARAHGLVSVPLFGAKREPLLRGRHHVLLDGERIGITFSAGLAEELPAPHDALSWSWSSNLTHSFTLDASREKLLVRRWDRPEEVDDRPLPTERQAADLLNSLAAADAPSQPTVVRKMLMVFRTIRGNIERLGGTILDAIHTFNAVLVWADACSKKTQKLSDPRSPVTLREVLRTIESESLAALDPSLVTSQVGDFPVRDLIEGLLERDPDTGYLLDPELLIRHAAGDLYQDAHIDFANKPHQPVERTLFPVVSLEAPRPRGRLKSDAHFTPPSLARVLVEQAVAAVAEVRPLPERIEVLDPACGSGVFLIEALREICYAGGRSVSLRGLDTSDVSQAMTDFCLRQAVLEGTPGDVSIDVKLQDALLPKSSWGKPDLILMNPPFAPWRSMSDPEREQVKKVLGNLYAGQADKALAFLWKAVRSLKPGAALGTLLPAPLLEGRSGQKFREAVEKDTDLKLVLVGRFSGLGYFKNVAVEPAFFVIVRSAESPAVRTPVRVVLASRESEDRAIRELRRVQTETTDSRGNWEILQTPRDSFSPVSWMPRSGVATAAIDAMTRAGVPRLGTLFDLQLGVKTGNNDIFILTDTQLDAIDPNEYERGLFRPVAEFSTIHDGAIRPDKYIFYPYGSDGKPLVDKDEQLQSAAPKFYSAYLRRNRAALEDRKSLRSRRWWELVEPRPTWQPPREPRLVGAIFAEPGKFAYDEGGDCCVVQGFAWLWKRPVFTGTELPFAYLALLNSRSFASVLAMFCPRVRAGQFDMYPKYVNRVFLPDLSDSSRTTVELLRELADIGHQISQGLKFDSSALERAVRQAYLSEPRAEHSPREAAGVGDISKEFKRLVSEWKVNRRSTSTAKRMAAHPAYQSIIQLGRPAVPHILAELERELDHWFIALHEITGASPVPEASRGKLAEMAKAWADWWRDQSQ